MKANMKKTIYYIAAVGLMISISVSSCKKLDEYNPASLSEANVLSNFNGWKAFQAGNYTGLFGSLIGLSYGIVSEVGTDLWTFPYNNGTNLREVMAYNGLTVDFGHVNNVW